MIEEDATVALRQWFEVACGPSESRIAAHAKMQNHGWAVTLDLMVEPDPTRRRGDQPRVDDVTQGDGSFNAINVR